MADQQQQDQGGGSWLPWVLGAGAVAAFGVAAGAAYLGYRALPYALAFDDPEAAEKFEAWRRGTPEQRREMAMGFARELGAELRGGSPAAAARPMSPGDRLRARAALREASPTPAPVTRPGGVFVAKFKDPDALHRLGDVPPDVRVVIDDVVRYGEYVDVQFDLDRESASVVNIAGQVLPAGSRGAPSRDEYFVTFNDSSAVDEAAQYAGVDEARARRAARPYVRHGGSVGIAFSSRGARVVPATSWPRS